MTGNIYNFVGGKPEKREWIQVFPSSRITALDWKENLKKDSQANLKTQFAMISKQMYDHVFMMDITYNDVLWK